MAGSPTIAGLFAQRVVIGVGDMSVSNNTAITLSTYALGSCVGVVAYDPVARVGGLLHLMLPESSLAPEKAAAQPAMFADTGLPLLFRALLGLRAERSRLRLFVAGGANVLGSGTDNFKIGERNIRATASYLNQNGYGVSRSDVGGTINRTVHLDIATGAIKLKTPGMNGEYSLAA
ncbi:MAG: chemotaxis protein CheD [Verrucomicrobia bacterium]|nr:chemotaxis protein CheD [Verrucomicrobiota bacterium]